MNELPRPDPAVADPATVGLAKDASEHDFAGEVQAGRIGRALSWSFGGTLVIRLLNVALGIALARLLGTEEFGVYAVALVALTAMLSLNELGVSVALVRYPGDERRIAGTVNTLAVAGSVVCSAFIWVAAPYLADAFGAPAATWPVRVMGLGIILDGLAATPAALLQRHLQQRERSVADVTSFVVGSVLSIVLVAMGTGAMSLAWGRVLGSVVSTGLILWYSPFRVRLQLRRAEIAPLLRVGAPLAGASLLVFLILNIDYLVVGHTSGARSLGVYMLAFNLAGWPVMLLSQPLRRVTVPVFARILATDGAFDRTLMQWFDGLLALTLPITATLGALAFPLVRLLYGHEWLASAPVLCWLAVLGASRVVLELLYDALVALGDTRRLFALQGIWLVALVIALPLGERWDGSVGVAIAHCLVAALLVIPLHLLLIGRRVGLGYLEWVTAALPSLGKAVVVVGVAAGLQLAMRPTLLTDLLVVAVTGAVGGVLTLRGALTLRKQTMNRSEADRAAPTALAFEP